MIYLDGAATKELNTVSKMAVEEGLECWGNPSSTYDFSDKAKSLINVARRRVADSIGAKVNEIVFTSGGSESDNMAIKGVVFASKKEKKHIITTKIEHKAVIETCRFLEKHGLAEVTYLDVYRDGTVSTEELEMAIKPETILISIMAVNNEIGSVQPLRKISEIARFHGILFHTDAVQAYGKINIDVNELGIDLMSASGHKIGTPKGVGFLYVREGTPIEPLIHGGKQEFGLRAGTENVPYINALGYSAMIIDPKKHHAETVQNKIRLTDALKEEFGNEIYFAVSPRNTLGVLNVGFKGIDAITMQAYLNLNNIYVSIGSACNSGAKQPSHVLEAVGVPEDMVHNYIRISMPDKKLSDDEVLQIVNTLKMGKFMFSDLSKG